jgi:hypothetical protein
LRRAAHRSCIHRFPVVAMSSPGSIRFRQAAHRVNRAARDTRRFGFVSWGVVYLMSAPSWAIPWWVGSVVRQSTAPDSGIVLCWHVIPRTGSDVGSAPPKGNTAPGHYSWRGRHMQPDPSTMASPTWECAGRASASTALRVAARPDCSLCDCSQLRRYAPLLRPCGRSGGNGACREVVCGTRLPPGSHRSALASCRLDSSHRLPSVRWFELEGCLCRLTAPRRDSI